MVLLIPEIHPGMQPHTTHSRVFTGSFFFGNGFCIISGSRLSFLPAYKKQGKEASGPLNQEYLYPGIQVQGDLCTCVYLINRILFQGR